MNILVTGGAGYIGSHTLIELYKAGHTAVVVDNLSNSNPEGLRRVAEIIGVSEIPFYEIDIRDCEGLDKVLTEHQCDACIHFAGLKAVGESVEKPWEYYENNISGTLTLIDVMRKHNCKNIIFSSSATVYGDPAEIPITENCPKGQCTNPYLTEDAEYKEYVQSKQLYRSGTSIGANVRESKHAQSDADFLSKMSIAYKEADETDFWLNLLHDNGYLDDKQFNSLENDITRLLKILTSIVKTMRIKLGLEKP